jgi:hypothetical protein
VAASCLCQLDVLHNKVSRILERQFHEITLQLLTWRYSLQYLELVNDARELSRIFFHNYSSYLNSNVVHLFAHPYTIHLNQSNNTKGKLQLHGSNESTCKVLLGTKAYLLQMVLFIMTFLPPQFTIFLQ